MTPRAAWEIPSCPSVLARNLVARAPGISSRVAAWLADLERRPGSREHERVRAALRAAMPELDHGARRRWCRGFWQARYRSWVEHRWLESLSGPALCREMTERVDVSGEEHLAAALAGAEPVVAFTPHFGSFLVTTLRMALEAQGRKQLFLFYDPPELNPYSPTMKALFDRMSVGAVSVFNERAGLVKVSKGLARGGVLGLMPDVYRWEPSAIFVPFFGRLEVFMAGTAFFALRFGARLLPLYGRQTGDRRFRVDVDAPLAVPEGPPTADAVFETTAAIARNLEEHIRRAPDQWVYWPRFGGRVGSALSLPVDSAGWDQALQRLCERSAVRAPAVRDLIAGLQSRLEKRPPSGTASAGSGGGTA